MEMQIGIVWSRPSKYPTLAAVAAPACTSTVSPRMTSGTSTFCVPLSLSVRRTYHPAILGEPNRAPSSRRELAVRPEGIDLRCADRIETRSRHDHENDLGGDFIALLRQERWIDSRTAVQQAGQLVRIPLTVSPRDATANDDEEMRRRLRIALEIWGALEDPAGTSVEAWLRSRGLNLPDVAAGRAIRLHPYLSFAGQGRHPAMVAVSSSTSGPTCRAPSTAPVLTKTNTRRRLNVLGGRSAPAGGAAIKLRSDEHVDTGPAIGEGIETTLAGMALGFTPGMGRRNAGGPDHFRSGRDRGALDLRSTPTSRPQANAVRAFARNPGRRPVRAGVSDTPNTVGADPE